MPETRSLTIRDREVRVLEEGRSDVPVVFLAGIGGVPAWTPFLEALAKNRRVIVPSLPGFPGATEFRHLDSLYDWVVHTLETLELLDEPTFDLIGSSVGGALASEIASLVETQIRRLVLIAPFGVFLEDDPAADIWAQVPGPKSIPNLVCSHPERWDAIWEMPADGDEIEWSLLQTRSMEAAARFLFPFGNTGVTSRLHRIHNSTLLVRGAEDRVLPSAYNAVFAEGIEGPVRTIEIKDAGHLPEIDNPEMVVREINAFLLDQEN
tara:strand:- start:185 stop:979 length:795 start_codon:yes stop_codon:yes gene_type:complete